ncbi:putative Sulfotransferase domain, P-loop containing nucleoside triphosphate hydrolase [Helianthus anomalus]
MSKLRSKDLTPLLLGEAFDLFCQGVSEYGPYREHVLSYWRASLESSDKILFMKYEDVKKQPKVVFANANIWIAIDVLLLSHYLVISSHLSMLLIVRSVTHYTITENLNTHLTPQHHHPKT